MEDVRLRSKGSPRPSPHDEEHGIGWEELQHGRADRSGEHRPSLHGDNESACAHSKAPGDEQEVPPASFDHTIGDPRTQDREPSPREERIGSRQEDMLNECLGIGCGDSRPMRQGLRDHRASWARGRSSRGASIQLASQRRG